MRILQKHYFEFVIRLTVLFLFITTVTVAQDGRYAIGARGNGTGSTSITNTDHWSVFNNVGSFGSLEESGVFFSYQNRYQLKSFQVIGGGATLHTKLFNIGAKYFKFGDDLFSQQLTGLVVGNSFQRVSLGLGLNIIQTAAEGQDTEHYLAIEFGGRAEVTNWLVFGAHIFNFRNSLDYPTTMKMGVTVLPIESIHLNLEVEKQLNFPELYKLGLEYQVIEKLFLRTGVNSQRTISGNSDIALAFGLGINPGRFQIDYSFNSQTTLGSIHECSASFSIGKK